MALIDGYVYKATDSAFVNSVNLRNAPLNRLPGIFCFWTAEYRRVSMAKLGQVQGKMDITFPQALRRVSESNQPTVNSDLK